MKQKHQQKPREHADLALERISALFKEADLAFPKDKALSKRYIVLARKISTKYKVKLPPELKKRFCKHCNSLLKPPQNCKIRLNRGRLVYHCLSCDSCMRYPYPKTNPRLKRKS